MELLEAQPKVLKSVGFPWKPLRLVPLGDMQVGAEGFNASRFGRFIDNALQRDSYFIGMGDYSDFLSPSNRRFLANAGLYDTAQQLIEEWHLTQLEGIKEMLKATKGRWLGLLQGHHYYEFDPMTTTDTELARYLDAPYLGDCAMVRVSFAKGNPTHPASLSKVIWAHHGAGGGVSAASALTKLERYAGYVDADVLLMGHQSKLGYLPKPRFGMSASRGRLGGKERHGTPRLVNRTQHLIATGAWMEGYHVGTPKRGRPQGSYVEKSMMVPAALGGMAVIFEPHLFPQSNSYEIRIRVEGGDD